MAEVLVLGAGVVGITTAYALARDGHSVTVIDAGGSPAERGASFGNGAQLSYSYTDAMASPSLVRNLPKYLLGLDPAIRLQPTLSPAFWRWSLEFLANSSRSRFESNTIEVLRLAIESRRGILELTQKLNFDHRCAGKLNLYGSVEAMRQAEALTQLKNAYGAQQVMLTRDQAIEREPALRAYGHTFAGALWSPLDESGDSRKFCCEFRHLLEREFGVKFWFGLKVRAIQTQQGKLCSVKTEADEISCTRAVIALGAWSRDIARTAGVNLPIWPTQGYSMTIPATDSAPAASITDTAHKVVFCRIGDRLRIAGLADIGKHRGEFRQHRFETLLETARSIFPQAGDYSADVQAWTGLRPMTPNSQPIIGLTKVGGLYVNCGHGSLGWTLSMGAASRLATVLQ
ncbi:FAD-dependent oxidoreductase [Sinorhizobium fredii]|uniref:FAD-dependent oxidoreductase n=1 Tax=Rhizobium fredii TaxID=380 RepID=UPI0004BBB046|nr:FAD-dependent oxidoreductase [Sinorhizobium fredii]ASY73861.1 D-amino acid dehydrogenase small subunit [Sinorhizobium fredii CCBAU 83666]